MEVEEMQKQIESMMPTPQQIVEHLDKKLEEAKKLYKTANSDQKYVLESLFPQLSESEDEKTRKEIIDFLLDGIWDTTIIDKVKQSQRYAKWISYLKNQGKQKPNYCHHEVDLSGCSEEYRKAYYDGWNNCNQQHAQLKAEQNPAWSKEDEKIYNLLYEEYKNIAHYSHSREKAEDIPGEVLGWLKSLKYRVQPQPKQKWSREDEEMIGNIRRIIAQDAFYNDAVDVNGELCEKMYIDADNWLKLLKDRFGCEVNCTTTKEWKPSDKQMEVLNWCKPLWNEPKTKAVLESLIKDLKKLREE